MAPSKTQTQPHGWSVRTGRSIVRRQGLASRLFGYDIFISFALGAPPRGTQSYASDLARRLRELDYTVFFSEDESPPGALLNSSLRNALRRSKLLVVIANRGTLQDPRWVRTEVQQFREYHPARPIIPISVDGALTDERFAKDAQGWLACADTIWLDETAAAGDAGIASEPMLQRLVTAPKHAKSNLRWRRVVRTVIGSLAALTVGLGVATKTALDSSNRARAELRRAVSLRLISESQAQLAAQPSGDDEGAILRAIAAQRIMRTGPVNPEVLNGVWRVLDARKELVRIVHTETPSTRIAWSPDGTRWISAEGARLVLRDAATGSVRMPLLHRGHEDYAWSSVAFSPDGIRVAAGDNGGRVVIWDARSGHELGTFADNHSPVTGLRYGPDGSWVAVAGTYEPLMLLDGRTAARISTPFGTDAAHATSVALSPDGRVLVAGAVNYVAGAASYVVRRWEVQGRRAVGPPLVGHEEQVSSLAFTPDGRLLISSGGGVMMDSVVQTRQSALMVWDVTTGARVGAPMLGHTAPVNEISVSAGGTLVASAGEDGTVRLWRLPGGEPIGAPLRGHRRNVAALDFSPDGMFVVSAGNDSTLRVWRTRGAQALRGTPATASGYIPPWVISPRATVGATPVDSNTIQRWDLRTARVMGSPVASHAGQFGIVLGISDDGRLAAIYSDTKVRVWDLDADRQVSAINGSDANRITVAGFNADASILATGDAAGALTLWKIQSGEAVRRPIKAHDASIIALAFSADGTRIASAGGESSLMQWNSANGQLIGSAIKVPAENTSVTGSLAYSPDDRRLVWSGGSFASRTMLYLWDASSGKLIGRPRVAHDNSSPGVAAAFSPDGRFLMTTSVDDVRFWDGETGEPIGEALSAHLGGRIAFSRAGTRILSPTSSDTLSSFAAPDGWADDLCSKITRNMTYTEWQEVVSSEIDYVVQCPELPAPPDGP